MSPVARPLLKQRRPIRVGVFPARDAASDLGGAADTGARSPAGVPPIRACSGREVAIGRAV
jgi:hypothetical protein